MRPEGARDARGLPLRHPKAKQELFGYVDRRKKRRALQVGHAEIEKTMRVRAVAGAGVDRQIGIAAPDNLRRAHGALDVVDSEHEGARAVRVGGVEDLRPARVAVERLTAEPFDELHLLGADVERGEGDALCPQDARHDLAEAPEAGDDDVAVIFRRGVVVRRGLSPPRQELLQLERDRRCRHRQRDDDAQELGGFPRQRARGVADGEEHKGELAALGECQPEPARRARLQPLPAAERIEHDRLDGDETGDEGENEARLLQDQPQVDRHADGGEEEPEQQPFEGLDVGLELVAVGGFGQQRAGDEGAERGRHARVLHEDGETDDGQQRRRRHRLLDAREGDEAHEMVEQIVPGDDRDGDDPEPSEAGDQIHFRRAVDGRDGEQRCQRDERDRRNVLKQQDREAETPVAGVEVARLLHDLQGKRCRRKGQRETNEDCRLPSEPKGKSDQGQHEAGYPDLRAAEPEHGVAHRPKPLGAQLEPDHEQQEHDAELGEVQKLLRLVVG